MVIIIYTILISSNSSSSSNSFFKLKYNCFQFSLVQSFSCVLLCVTTWTAAPQASLSIIDPRSLHKLMSMEVSGSEASDASNPSGTESLVCLEQQARALLPTAPTHD